MPVYVVGSVNGDVTLPVEELPVPGSTVPAGEPVRAGGGKGANVAVAAARDGRQVRLIAAVGDDGNGERGLSDLAADGVATAGVAVLQGRATGLAVICVDARGENFVVVAPGANAALTAELVTTGLADLGPDDVCVLSFEVPDAAVRAAARVAAQRSVRVVVNPSPVRPLGPALVAARPVIVANAGEVRRLTSQDKPPAGAQMLCERGCATVVATLGAKGALVLTENGECQSIPARRAETVDTTGAGDTFTGVFAGALESGSSAVDAAHRGAAAAALSTERVGARAAMPRTELIDHALGGR